MIHNITHLSKLMYRTHDELQVCEITGATLLSLQKAGDKLSVDRKDNRLGYVPSNTRIIALSLNESKGSKTEVPSKAQARLINRLRRRGGASDGQKAI